MVYEETRQSGSHIRVRSTVKGFEHHFTIPAHTSLKIGTLSGILLEVATYLEISKEELAREFLAETLEEGRASPATTRQNTSNC